MANCLLKELEKLEYEIVEMVPELKEDEDLDRDDHEWKEDFSTYEVCQDLSDLDIYLDYDADDDDGELEDIIGEDLTLPKDKICVFFDNLEKYITDDTSLFREDIDNIFEYLSKMQSSYKDLIVIGISDSKSITRNWPYFGFFENRLHIEETTYKDREEIISHLLSEMKYGKVNNDDITSMIPKYYTYKQIKSLIRKASITSINWLYDTNSGISSEEISTYLLVEAFNNMEYDLDMLEIKDSEESINETAVHEAGHAVVGHILNPGSVSFVSMASAGRKNNGTDGTTYYDGSSNYLDRICNSLGSIASVELKLHKRAFGTSGDIYSAVVMSEFLVKENAHCGLSLVSYGLDEPTHELTRKQEDAIHNLLQEQYIRAKMIIQSNMELLDFITEELLRKGYIFKSEIQKYCIDNNIKAFNEGNVFNTSVYHKGINFRDILGGFDA